MARLQVTTELLAGASNRCRESAHSLQALARAARGESDLAGACGSTALVDATARFQDRWARTIEALARDHEALAAQLARAALTYDTTEHEVVPLPSPDPAGPTGLVLSAAPAQPTPQPQPQPSPRP